MLNTRVASALAIASDSVHVASRAFVDFLKEIADEKRNTRVATVLAAVIAGRKGDLHAQG